MKITQITAIKIIATEVTVNASGKYISNEGRYRRADISRDGELSATLDIFPNSVGIKYNLSSDLDHIARAT